MDVLTASELKDAGVFPALRHLSTLKHSDTSNTFSKAEIYQQESPFPLQLLTVYVVTCGLNEVFMPMGKTILGCIKHSTIHGLKAPHPKHDHMFTSHKRSCYRMAWASGSEFFCPIFCVWVSP